MILWQGSTGLLFLLNIEHVCLHCSCFPVTQIQRRQGHKICFNSAADGATQVIPKNISNNRINKKVCYLGTHKNVFNSSARTMKQQQKIGDMSMVTKHMVTPKVTPDDMVIIFIVWIVILFHQALTLYPLSEHNTNTVQCSTVKYSIV